MGLPLTRGVAWVDDDDGLGRAHLTRLLVRPRQLVHLQGPVVALVQVVAGLRGERAY